VKCKINISDNDCDYDKFCLVPENFTHNSSPNIVTPIGLKCEKRQNYLYKEVRKFVPNYAKDLLCPKPVNISNLDVSSSKDSEENTTSIISIKKKENLAFVAK
jgi:hypothetical protein